MTMRELWVYVALAWDRGHVPETLRLMRHVVLEACLYWAIVHRGTSDAIRDRVTGTRTEIPGGSASRPLNREA